VATGEPQSRLTWHCLIATVIPAQAGIQPLVGDPWIRACAGMTRNLHFAVLLLAKNFS